MKDTPLDPLRLDVQALARRAGDLAGEWPQTLIPRLLASQDALAADATVPAVRWQLRGELRAAAGASPEMWLHLQAHTDVSLQCQRCLMPLRQTLDVRRSFLFVTDEAEAERLDEESEDDVLVLTRSLNVPELVEDELILALPLVPRHEHCLQPLATMGAIDESAPRASPFAVLESLRVPGAKR